MIEIKFSRKDGKTLMTVNAKDFQDYLSSLGVKKDRWGERFMNAPDTDIINARDNKLCCGALLYCGSNGTLVVNLADFYSGPVTDRVLTAIGESAQACVDRILEHYRPIEISVRIVKRKPLPSEVAAETATATATEAA